MSAWREEFADSFLLFVVLMSFIVVPWVHLHYSRYGRWRGWPAIVSAATFLYACALFAFTTFPFPDISDPDLCDGASLRSHWQTQPLASLGDVTSYAAENGLVATVTSGVFLQVLFNVVFFIPLGFLLAYRWRRTLVQALGISLLVSLAIEATQGTGLWGLMPCPYRLADVDDLITNTLGGVIGWVLGRWLGRRLPSPRPVREDDLDPPTGRRIALANAMDIYTMVFAFVLTALALAYLDLAFVRGEVPLVLVDLALSAALFVVVPSLRRDRSGPGIAAANLVMISTASGNPAPWWALTVRWALWWVPFAVFGVAALALMVVVDAATSLLRRDRRGLRSLLTGTTYVTRAAWQDSRARASGQPGDS